MAEQGRQEHASASTAKALPAGRTYLSHKRTVSGRICKAMKIVAQCSVYQARDSAALSSATCRAGWATG